MGKLDRWLEVQADDTQDRVNLASGQCRFTVTIDMLTGMQLDLLAKRLMMPKTRLASKLVRLSIADIWDQLGMVMPAPAPPPSDMSPEDVRDAEAVSKARLQARLAGLELSVQAEEVSDTAIVTEVEA
jgi:hypothetical protein